MENISWLQSNFYNQNVFNVLWFFSMLVQQ